MLYLAPPYDIIQGVSVFRDHDPATNQFYYLPTAPHLTVIDNATSFNLIKFTGEAGSGGFLDFDVDLGIDQETEDEIRSTLRTKYHLSQPPNLIPVIVENGSVRLMILGKKTAEAPTPGGQIPSAPPPPEPAELPEFVLKIDHFAKPSLYGNNAAAFSVQLDEYGVVIIEQSLKGILQPIGIVYSLEFLALRPAFNVKVTADWNRVQTHFDESFSASVFFLSTDVEKVIDKLIEDQVIKIEVDDFIPEGEDSASVISDRTKAVNEIKDMITHTFFQPSINPVSTAKDGWDKATDTALAINKLAVTGGWGGIATLSYKKIDTTRIDQKSFNFNMTERTTVRRTIYPQAHLEGLTRALRAGGPINLDDYVHPINIDDPFFKRRTVDVINRADLTQDSITSVNVSLNYGNEPRNVILDGATAKASVDWASILQNNAMVRDVTYNYKVTFQGVDTADRPGVLQSPDATSPNDALEINPRSDGLYSIISVPITSLDFPFDMYPNVEVQLRYNDPEHQISLNDTFILKKDLTEVRWPFFLRDPEKKTFDYKVIFRAHDNRDLEWDWRSTDQQEVILRDPRPNKRTVTIVPAVNWNQIAMVFVDVAYRDDENGVRAEQSYTFDSTETGKARQTFSVALADPDKRLITYNAKFLLTDNSESDLPVSQTLANQIIVRADLKGHRVITVEPEQVDFAGCNVDRIQVDLLYQDDDNGLSFAGSFTFRSKTDRGFFEFDYVDPQKAGYTAQLTTVFLDGFSFTRDPQPDTREVLVLPVGNS
jgi:hypothetical protein